MLAHPLPLEEATREINRWAGDDQTGFALTSHARHRMDERGMPENTVSLVCRRGRAVECRAPDAQNPDYRYKMAFTDSWDDLEVVVALKENARGRRILVVTVI